MANGKVKKGNSTNELSEVAGRLDKDDDLELEIVVEETEDIVELFEIEADEILLLELVID